MNSRDSLDTLFRDKGYTAEDNAIGPTEPMFQVAEGRRLRLPVLLLRQPAEPRYPGARVRRRRQDRRPLRELRGAVRELPGSLRAGRSHVLHGHAVSGEVSRRRVHDVARFLESCAVSDGWLQHHVPAGGQGEEHGAGRGVCRRASWERARDDPGRGRSTARAAPSSDRTGRCTSPKRTKEKSGGSSIGASRRSSNAAVRRLYESHAEGTQHLCRHRDCRGCCGAHHRAVRASDSGARPGKRRSEPRRRVRSRTGCGRSRFRTTGCSARRSAWRSTRAITSSSSTAANRALDQKFASQMSFTKTAAGGFAPPSAGNTVAGYAPSDATKPISEFCCTAAPPVLEFDPEGNLVNHWGGTGAGYEWPPSMHGITIDGKDNVWLAGNAGHSVLKFSKDGKFLLQIGRNGASKGNNDTANLNRPAEVEIDMAANEVYVADGYGNRRVIVFDADSGKFKRMWGAYGKPPTDDPNVVYDPAQPLSTNWQTVHCASLANDGLVYVCDRVNNRIQVFTQGRQVREGSADREAHAGRRRHVRRRLLARCPAAPDVRGRRRQPPRVAAASRAASGAEPHRQRRPLSRASSTPCTTCRSTRRATCTPWRPTPARVCRSSPTRDCRRLRSPRGTTTRGGATGAEAGPC